MDAIPVYMYTVVPAIRKSIGTKFYVHPNNLILDGHCMIVDVLKAGEVPLESKIDTYYEKLHSSLKRQVLCALPFDRIIARRLDGDLHGRYLVLPERHYQELCSVCQLETDYSLN